MNSVTKRALSLAGTLVLLLVPTATAFAAAPTLDSGAVLNQTSPYSGVQSVGDVFSNHGFYGVVQGDTPVDILTFTPSHSGNATFELLVDQTTPVSDQPGLILVDKTSNTQSNWNIPTPSSDYHAYLMKQVTTPLTYSEPALFKSYSVIANDTVQVTGGDQYYLVVLGANGNPVHYAIKFGTGQAWSVSDVFKSFGSWIRLQTDTYAGQTPFAFKVQSVGMILLLLGFALLLGIWLIQQVFSFLANRTKMAGYILIKMQPFSRIFTWIALWFSLIGGIIYFDKTGWTGSQFVVAVIFVLLVIIELVYTLWLSRKLDGLEVSKQEATIPLGLRRWLFGYFVLSLLAYGSFATILSIYLARV